MKKEDFVEIYWGYLLIKGRIRGRIGYDIDWNGGYKGFFVDFCSVFTKT